MVATFALSGQQAKPGDHFRAMFKRDPKEFLRRFVTVKHGSTHAHQRPKNSQNSGLEKVMTTVLFHKAKRSQGSTVSNY